MNNTAQKYGASTLPGVNLLPKELAQRKAMRVVAVGAVLAILGALVLTGIAVAGGYAAKSVAASGLSSAATDEKTALHARDQKRNIYDAVVQREAAEYTLAQIGLGEADYAALSAAVQSTADANSVFESISFTGPNALQTGGSEAEGEIYGSGVGLLKFKAHTISMEEATVLVARLEAIQGIANVRATVELYASEGADTSYVVEGHGSITVKAMTMRLVPKSGLTNVSTLLVPESKGAPATPAPVPKPSPTAGGKG
jgi:hypothetical protein